MALGVYSVHGDAQSVSTAITILEVTAPATAILLVNKAWVQQSGSTTSAMVRVRILRKTATITGTAAPPSPVPHAAAAASGATVKWIATVEGTDGNVIVVPPSGLIAIKFPAAPANTSYTFGFEYEELG